VITAEGITAVATAVGVGVGLALHVLKYAYDKGQCDNRLKNIEQTQTGFGDVHGLIGSIQATMEALNKSVERLDRAVENLSRRS
jgi:hypothetical protein